MLTPALVGDGSRLHRVHGRMACQGKTKQPVGWWGAARKEPPLRFLSLDLLPEEPSHVRMSCRRS